MCAYYSVILHADGNVMLLSQSNNTYGAQALLERNLFIAYCFKNDDVDKFQFDLEH